MAAKFAELKNEDTSFSDWFCFYILQLELHFF
jgi:hypothetical protein